MFHIIHIFKPVV